LICIDLAEYSQESSTHKLLGAPPGLAGFEEGGYLCDIIMHQPFAVLYFDHVDQAHPQVLGILLQILESGRITDGRGRIADFTNALVIFSITVQSSHLGHWSDGGSPLSWEQVLQWAEDHDDLAVRQKLGLMINKPELIQLLDEIIVFRRLSPVHLTRILGVIVDELNHRLRLQGQNIRLRLGPHLSEHLVAQAKKSGPASLKRLFTKVVLNPLSEKILMDPKLMEGSWLVDWSPEGLEWLPDYIAKTYLAS
jgi:ATP-dependent Clp protease ATP-binding subunit ClpB